jgi:hypothetical protein
MAVGPSGDKYEREADHVAKQVLGQMKGAGEQPVQRQGIEEEELQMKPLQRQGVEEEELQMKPLQRQGVEEEELQMKPLQRQGIEEEELQMKPLQRQIGMEGGEVGPELEQSIERSRGKGQALPENLRRSMEGPFGEDFSGVRVHTDAQAHDLNDSVSARAFTTGQDIFFRKGEYNPGSDGGKQILAHELTHVVQQVQKPLHRHTDYPNPLESSGIHRSPLLKSSSAPTIRRGVDEAKAVTDLRVLLPEGNSSGAGLVSALAATSDSIRQLPTQIHTATSDLQFQQEMAKYMAIRDGLREEEYERYMASAQQQLDDNKARGFTNQKSEMWFPPESAGGTALSDIIHETIHVMCAQGGAGEVLRVLDTSFNEGLTQMFTIQVCTQHGIPVEEAYPEATKFNQELYKKYPTELYNAYFKQNVDALLDSILKNWGAGVEKGKFPNGDNPVYSEKKTGFWDVSNEDERRKMLVSNLQDYRRKERWLNARVL